MRQFLLIFVSLTFHLIAGCSPSSADNDGGVSFSDDASVRSDRDAGGGVPLADAATDTLLEDASHDSAAIKGYCEARCAYEQRCNFWDAGKCTAECIGWNESKLEPVFVATAAACYETDKCASTGSSQGCIVKGIFASGVSEEVMRWCVDALYMTCGGAFAPLSNIQSETLCRNVRMLRAEGRTASALCGKSSCTSIAACVDALFH